MYWISNTHGFPSVVWCLRQMRAVSTCGCVVKVCIWNKCVNFRTSTRMASCPMPTSWPICFLPRNQRRMGAHRHHPTHWATSPKGLNLLVLHYILEHSSVHNPTTACLELNLDSVKVSHKSGEMCPIFQTYLHSKKLRKNDTIKVGK